MDIKLFLTHLKEEQNKSDKTIEAYGRDLSSFYKYICESGRGENLADVTKTDIIAYIMELKELGKSNSTISRNLSSIRGFYRYAVSCDLVKNNPAEGIKVPKTEKKQLEYLTENEMEILLSLPGDTAKGIRDRAMFELMYATGIRVSELIELKGSDINLKMDFVTCDGKHGKARIVPFGCHAKKALKNYMETSRNIFMGYTEKEEKYLPLFVNYMGKELTRQGFWKILKAYGDKTDFADKLSPQVIRNTFAVHMIQNGADLRTLQELMGHEDMQAMQAYLSVTKSRIKDVYNKTHPRA